MPRTRRQTKDARKESKNSDAVKKLDNQKEVEAYLKDFDLNCKILFQNLDVERDNVLDEIKFMAKRCKDLIPSSIGNMPMENLPDDLTESIILTAMTEVTHQSNMLQASHVLQPVNIQKKRRSKSATANEDLTITDRKNFKKHRFRADQAEVTRKSRSLSRSRVPEVKRQNGTSCTNTQTPLNRLCSGNACGFITPKVKPNTPQVILRRPQEGELAISMQGSPLMVNHIVSREANVNIPLNDGRVISIQPQHGLRASQLPSIDQSLIQQIEVLRDNLIKVCEIADNKRNNVSLLKTQM
ncbi:putative cell division cycle-associated protein 8 [Trypoxylus dichotomus]